MKYFLDTEFHEYFKKPISWLPSIGSFNRRYHTIELISIGIKADDGREYYALSNEFNVRAAYNQHEVIPFLTSKNHDVNSRREYWLRDNVLKPIFYSFYKPNLVNLHHTYDMSLSSMKSVFKYSGKSHKQIALDVVNFIDQRYLDPKEPKRGFIYPGNTTINSVASTDVEFYAYFADYDWVLFCSLFGRMIDLPAGIPMYCNDLKQNLDEQQQRWIELGEDGRTEFMLKKTKRPYSIEVDLTKLSNYPLQENEHNALEDAKWNFKLYKFLQEIK